MTGANTAAPVDARFPAGQTIKDWADALIAKLDTTLGWGPLSATTIAADEQALETWANQESGGYNPNAPGGMNNPLNTTEGALGYVGQGGRQGNIKDFGTFDQGVQAQAYNLVHTTGASYEPIVAALKAGDVNGLFSSVDASKFGTHGLGPNSKVGTGPTGAHLTNAITDYLSGGILGVFGQSPLSALHIDPWPTVLKGIVLTGGFALIVLGAWRSVSPSTRQTVTGATTGAAKTAALA